MTGNSRISIEELVKHGTKEDCWLVVNGKVYDLSDFAPQHPGGPEVIYKYAGKDATEIYNQYHSATLIATTLPPIAHKGTLDTTTITQTWLSSHPNFKSTSTPPTSKPSLNTLLNLTDFTTAFRTASPTPQAQAYMSSASNDLLTHHANLSAWSRLWFRPRILRDVSRVNTTTTMLGMKVTMPVHIAPMGVARTAGPEGETALAKGAERAGILYCVAGTTGSMSLEEVVGSGIEGGTLMVQIYVDRERRKTEEVLRRVERLDRIKAVVVTVDLPVVSKREEDDRLKVASGDGGLARQTGSFIDPAFSWKDLAWLRRQTKLPILVKGVQCAADARRALKMGCAGIVVSNHGGRALDNAPATLLILLELRRDCPEVFRKMEVLIDGGVRRGSDVLKAIMIGAAGVGVGRPFQSAVAYETEGVAAVASILQDELETAMRLCGISDLALVRGDMSYLNTAELDRLLPPRRHWLFSRPEAKL